MKHVKLFEAFSTISLTEDQINWLDECTAGSWRLNPSTGLVDVDGDFNCRGQGLKDFKGVRFGHVRVDFYCDNNQLTSLDGAPKTVNGDFICYYNQLTSLEGAPQTVGGDFSCANNQLTSLVGAPKTVNGDFICYYNQLTSLKGAPETVDGYFHCANNQLTSLKGAPETVKGDFLCAYNQLTSLDGAPETVDGSFICDNNQLTSPVGAPETVGGGFSCKGNPISERTLASIFKIMKNGKSYQQALEEFWSKMGHEERALMYKDHSSLTPEEIRRYDALDTVNRIKNYL